MEKKYTKQDFKDLVKQYLNLKDYFGDYDTLRFECVGFTKDDFDITVDNENVYIKGINKNGDKINKYVKYPKGTTKINISVYDDVFTALFDISPNDIEIEYKN